MSMLARCCSCFRSKPQIQAAPQQMKLQGVYKTSPEHYIAEKSAPPIIMENKGGSELIIKNPSVLSKSEYRNNPKPLLENSGNKVKFNKKGSYHTVQKE